MNSLKIRLLGSSVIVLLLFIIVIGLILDHSYRSKSQAQVNLNLQSQIYDLERRAELDQDGNLVIPQLFKVKSGHYAAIARAGKIIWRSKSTSTDDSEDIPFNTDIKPGQRIFTTVKTKEGTSLFLLSLGYVWIDKHDQPLLFIFNVAESNQIYKQELIAYRHNLWLILSAIVLLYTILQGFILTWSLKPFIKIRQDLLDIGQGSREYLDSNFISEIKNLTSAFNTLLRSERARQERYKNSLGDLAHSFKTPLAVIKSTINNEVVNEKVKKVLVEQVLNLDELVTYQLKRAQTLGTRSSLSKPVSLNQVIDKVAGALLKVYRDKNVELVKDLQEGTVFYGEEGDILELLGNLLDNAFKWCRKKVKISANIEELETARVLNVIVEDDGSGIDDNLKQAILQRGVRADEQTPGYGIGMSILTEIVQAYCGNVTVADSELGGAKFIVSFKH